MKKSKIVLSMIFMSLLLIGCQNDFQPKDVKLAWFDPTIYNQELFNRCYGDGYIHWVPGDPYYCPIYTKEELAVKFTKYLSIENYTFVQDVGIHDVYESLEQLQIDYESLIDDEETLKRVQNIDFYAVIALDEHESEKVVYFPSYMPKGNNTQLFIYDSPFDILVSEIKNYMNHHEPIEISFDFDGYQIVDGGKEVKINLDIEMLLTKDVFDEITLLKDASIFLGKIHYETYINYIGYDNGIEVENSRRKLYFLLESRVLNIYAYTGRNLQDDIEYKVVYTLDFNT